jgi:hypothetical protein
MITEIVTFKLPAGMTHDDVVANFQKTAPNWRANPDLIRKNYLVDARKRVAGGVYLWRERAHAEKWHGEAFRNKVKEIYIYRLRRVLGWRNRNELAGEVNISFCRDAEQSRGNTERTTEDFKHQPETRSTQTLHPVWFYI